MVERTVITALSPDSAQGSARQLGYTGNMKVLDPEDLVGQGLTTQPEPLRRAENGESGVVSFHDRSPASDAAAHNLVDNLFARNHRAIPGLSYAVTYKLADGPSGGDIADVYRFDNDAVAFSIADILGKGPRAAVHAALIKYSMRAYASQGLTPEKVLRALDRLYLENNAFENNESFASVFLGVIDSTRRYLTYASAGHEPIFVVHPDGSVVNLNVTAPLIGVFDDQHHLFKQNLVQLQAGSLIVATTDGVAEAHSDPTRLFGMERLIAEVVEHRSASEETIAEGVLWAVRSVL